MITEIYGAVAAGNGSLEDLRNNFSFAESTATDVLAAEITNRYSRVSLSFPEEPTQLTLEGVTPVVVKSAAPELIPPNKS